ncbi:MAG: hypothetical protein WBB08_01575 [Halobacteriota archaeon]
METNRKGKAIIGISMAAIMVVSVLVAAMPMAVATSDGTNFNTIRGSGTQKVLIGQNLQFEGFTGTVTVSRILSGDVENVYQTDAINRLYNVNWPTSGAYYVNYDPATKLGAAQLSVGVPDVPLELKVGTKRVASIAEGTNLKVYTGGMNLFGEDMVDLVIIGPDGRIKKDPANNQDFTDISVNELKYYEAVPQINHRTLLYIKTMTVNQHKSKIHDTPGVNTNKILKNCYLRCKISYQTDLPTSN